MSALDGADEAISREEARLLARLEKKKRGAGTATTSSPTSGATASGLGGAKDVCGICDKRVYPMEKLKAGGDIYHRLCFRCTSCKTTLSVSTFVNFEGSPYCTRHVPKLTSTPHAGLVTSTAEPAVEAVEASPEAIRAARDENVSMVGMNSILNNIRNADQMMSGIGSSGGGGAEGVLSELSAVSASLPESGDENICGVCTLEIDGSRTQVFNSFYHPACVVCASCTRVITGAVKESFKDRKAYCAACYANLPKDTARTMREIKHNCFRCGQVLDADNVKVKDRHYCFTCFTCADCGKQFAHNSGESGDHTVVEGRIVCHDCRFVGICPGCGNGIDSTVFLKLGNSKYHKNCVACSVCDAKIEEVYMNEGVMYCAEHRPAAQAAAAAQKTCTKCGLGIEGKAVKALGRSWHKDCLTCHRCGDLVGKGQEKDKFFNYAEEPHCATCWQIAANS